MSREHLVLTVTISRWKARTQRAASGKPWRTDAGCQISLNYKDKIIHLLDCLTRLDTFTHAKQSQ